MNAREAHKQRSDATKQKIIDCIDGHFAHTVRDIANHVAMSSQYVHSRLSELVKQGRLERFAVDKIGYYVMPGDLSNGRPSTVPNARVIRERHVRAPLRKNYIGARMATPLGSV
ncbi:MAG TPA: winged helix-turn-helix transcriptional regulator [Methylovorus sp.]|nr:winged helix-turn-helix transcriptional regulator [Methylovorus sp.]